mmetsp:Transcript_56969/g.68181  ORF Transcript_56969/g.68181 Transcript_56969/m.68181 type:complete len:202 (-) Transcript_56969:198-803(-)|eukprot:CAMPEP_0172489740 /NCGR_PEP_ID=MMETSP1066-20121228/19947_1 /TAXON_ID=671091 /ORGANISM="Coscinodiscus wailesii, Strain CCMP2513" /LENGTH=201 /DNA_ID=CAMNT_0013257821 /DNA_START=247 /DNA_END=852 /DNA_ORIENTATION=+
MRHQYQPPLLSPAISTSLDPLVDKLNAVTSCRSKQQQQPPILALLVGTNDGVGLVRCFGSAKNNKTLSIINDDLLSGVESVWATLPLGAGHHLKSLDVGDVRIVTAFYETVVLVHVHLSPLVVTFLATPEANIGAVREVIPQLTEALEPIRRGLIDSLNGGGGGTVVGAGGHNAGNDVVARVVPVDYGAGVEGMGYADMRR